MYWISGKKKRDPHLRWALPDRIFFGRGACHILAGAYLRLLPSSGFYAERIIPDAGHSGNHIYVTDGIIAFDFHGYTVRERLLAQHRRGWSARYPGWSRRIEPVDFDLLNTEALNARKMLGPDQYLYDALDRAQRFLTKTDHEKASARARAIAATDINALG